MATNEERFVAWLNRPRTNISENWTRRALIDTIQSERERVADVARRIVELPAVYHLSVYEGAGRWRSIGMAPANEERLSGGGDNYIDRAAIMALVRELTNGPS